MIKIRNAVKSDIPGIMQFIKEYWNENHIFANNKPFFEYVHGGKADEEKIHYIIAEDDENGKIYGIEGYIMMNDEKQPDIAGTMLKALPCSYFMLGMKMREYLMASLNARLICSPGINMQTNGVIAQYLGYHIDRLKQYYRLNDRAHYNVAKVNHKKILQAEPSGYSLVKIKDIEAFSLVVDDKQLRKKRPYKSLEYINNRYFRHTIYQYEVYAIQNSAGEKKAAIVLRKVECNGSRIGKIVDFFGEDSELAFVSQCLDKLMTERDYEYIDFYCYGIADPVLKRAGFNLRDEEDVNIIPNYFEPFLQQNVDIYFLCNDIKDIYVYRGDGDQDRPSR